MVSELSPTTVLLARGGPSKSRNSNPSLPSLLRAASQRPGDKRLWRERGLGSDFPALFSPQRLSKAGRPDQLKDASPPPAERPGRLPLYLWVRWDPETLGRGPALLLAAGTRELVPPLSSGGADSWETPGAPWCDPPRGRPGPVMVEATSRGKKGPVFTRSPRWPPG